MGVVMVKHNMREALDRADYASILRSHLIVLPVVVVEQAESID